MSQKRNREERQKKREQQPTVNQEIVSNVDKPFLVRIYDKLIPGEYTRKQDFHHMLVVFAFILVLAGAIAFGWWSFTQKEIDSTAATLLIPKTSFVEGQQSNVVDMLDGYGFKNIEEDDNGNIVAYGTNSMVNQYKESYRTDILQPVLDSMEDDYTSYGIEKMELSDDAKTLSMYTLDKITESSEIVSLSMSNNDISNIIYVCSNWCQIRNDGEKMKVNLIDLVSGENYYSFEPRNGDSIVADIEAKERANENAAENTASNNSNNTSETENNTNQESKETGEEK